VQSPAVALLLDLGLTPRYVPAIIVLSADAGTPVTSGTMAHWSPVSRSITDRGIYDPW
jgi:hypothetical protein